MVTAAVISEEMKIPKGFLHQILPILQRNGLVEARPGRTCCEFRGSLHHSRPELVLSRRRGEPAMCFDYFVVGNLQQQNPE